MLHTTNRTSQRQTTLRCVWMPMHTGANAPLVAVWIETAQLDSPSHEDPDLSFDAPDSRPCAA